MTGHGRNRIDPSTFTVSGSGQLMPVKPPASVPRPASPVPTGRHSWEASRPTGECPTGRPTYVFNPDAVTLSPSGEIQARQIEDVNGEHPFFVWDGDVQWSLGVPKRDEWVVMNRYRPDGGTEVAVEFWSTSRKAAVERRVIGFAGPSWWPWAAPLIVRIDRLRDKAHALALKLNRQRELSMTPRLMRGVSELPIPHEISECNQMTSTTATTTSVPCPNCLRLVQLPADKKATACPWCHGKVSAPMAEKVATKGEIVNGSSDDFFSASVHVGVKS